jgi:hypothetical protein
MAKTLTITLDAAMDERETERLVQRMRTLVGVREAGLIAPGSKSRSARRMAYALLEADTDEEGARGEISRLDGVVSCEVPARRFTL